MTHDPTTSTFRVPPGDDGQRLDKLVARHLGISRRQARERIGAGLVRVRGRVVRVLGRAVPAQAVVAVMAAPADEGEAARRRAEAAELLRAISVLHLDRWVLAVGKPAGLLSESDHRGRVSLEALAPEILAGAGERRREVWLAHRLDRGTSGVLLLARTKTAARELGRAFAGGGVRKEYLALCAGRLERDRDVNAALLRGPQGRSRVDAAGKPARTMLEPLAATEAASLVRARPRTGRTHQVRLHLAHLGHPILGDERYGGPPHLPGHPEHPLPLFLLHAARIRLSHPITQEPLDLRAPVPEAFRTAASTLGLRLPGE